MLLCPLRWSHALLVLHLQVGALTYEELAHFEAILLDGVVNRPLILRIDHVGVSSIAYQLLNSLDPAFSDSIVDWSLAIFVLSIDLVSTFCAQVVNHICEALPTGIEER